MTATLTAIHIYPVKSCRAVAMQRVEIAGTGLFGDRLFQVVDAEGNPVTQRQKSVLATVQPALTDAELRLDAPDRPTLNVPIPTVPNTTVKSLLGVPVEAGDAGDEAATWFSDLLGVPARLVAMTDRSDYRLPLPGIDMTLSWADGSAVLVANAASLEWLAGRAGDPFGMDRFRPNLTVDTNEAWVEDTWRDFSIGAARFGLGLAWPRCAIPQIDQIDGSRHKEPAKVLKKHRWCSDAASAGEALRPLFEGNALFGIGCSVQPVGAMVAIGDKVTVHETGERLIPAPT
jgi:uncharacterized protein YcbX